MPKRAVISRIPAGWRSVRIGDVVRQAGERVKVEAEQSYNMTGVKWYGEGVFARETVLGKEMSANYVTPLIPGALIYNRLFAWKGSFAVVPEDFGEQYVSNEFPQFVVDPDKVLPEYLYLYCMTPKVMDAVNRASAGSAAVSRNRLKESAFLDIDFLLPPLDVQRAIVEKRRKARAAAECFEQEAKQSEASIPQIVYEHLGVPEPKPESAKRRVMVMNWSQMERWSFNYLRRAEAGLLGFVVSRYPVELLQKHLIETMNGYCIKPVDRETAWKMLKLSALRPAGLDLDETKYVEVSEKIAQRFSIQEGDLLICRSVGSYEMVAKCALAEENLPGVLFPDIIIRVRFRDSLLPAYVREVMQTPLGRSYFQSNARTAVGMWKIGAADIENSPIPVPPLEVQETLVDTIRQARHQAAAARAQAEALKARAAAEIEAAILGGAAAGPEALDAA